MQSLEIFMERSETIPAVQEGAFSVKRDKNIDGEVEWIYEAREISGKIVEIKTKIVDELKGVELKLATEYGEAVVEYPREFSVDDERKLLNQKINHRRFQQKYSEDTCDGACYDREYVMNILSGELTGLLKSRTEFIK